MTEPAEGVGRLLAAARRPVVFTGAGVSTESGIPDFRSPGGVWERFDPREMTYQNFLGSETARRKYWEIGRQSYALMRTAEPNAAHRALAELYRLERLDCCLTQNVDNLHQRGGLPADRVIELHGNATRARCLGCERPYSRDEVQEWLEQGVALPACPACGGIVKPHTILFGEPMPAAATLEAERRARAADVFVVVGSSLVVYPAAYMPVHAKHAGATLVIINLSPTPSDALADVVIRGRAGEVLEAIVGHVRRLL